MVPKNKERVFYIMKNIANTFVSFVAVIAAALIATTCAVVVKPETTTVSFDATDSAPGFGISLKLPDGWNIGDGSESYRPGITESMLAITDKDGNKVGALGTSFYTDYSQFDDPQYPEPFSPNYYQCVYPELRLAAHCIWDIDPATSIRTDVGETMLAGIYAQIPEKGVPAVEWEVVESKGIVSYDDSKHVYTFISFRTSEYDISDETIQEIAESLEFAAEK